MRRTTRYLTGLLSATALVASLGVGTAQAEDAPATPAPKTVQAGMRITFELEPGYMKDPDTPINLTRCTLGAVGTDSMNRKIGITAGHCNGLKVTDAPGDAVIPSGVPKDVPVTDSEKVRHPVYDWTETRGAAGPHPAPIGWIRYASKDGTVANTVENLNLLDYMVIEFAPHVTLSSTLMTAPKYKSRSDGSVFRAGGGDGDLPLEVDVPPRPLFKMNKVYSDAAGNPVNPGIGANLGQVGWTSMQMHAQGTNLLVGIDPTPDPTLVPTGYIFNSQNGYLRSTTFSRGGDSGGPAGVVGRSNEWAGIVVGSAGPVSYVYQSAKLILDHLNGRTCTDSGATVPCPGAGFQITNN
ncbi:hypothetical protein [Rhodococcus kronopolitis]|uniref:Peptidase S1 domain-containing protein n=1 Tax=Rhodococcus kronopolitis TaxID=1460226 RepID=A0ABV9FUD7_9NOCA